MTSHSSHSVTAVTLPHLFTPVEIAQALGCSEWWVKEQAKRRRIPFTRPGGAYRFTAEHFEEIVRLFEERPSRRPEGRGVAPARRTRSRREGDPPPARLVARPPRRSRQAHPLAA
ncbi:helix-turn-helix domain-containing protein [Streptomyces sp. B1866]|uniref:helix-turn-helix domain-containing protein n=1 Tax=Streptomyces sp. B1866 TaxID=3075431 RepID=UPI00288F7642|nr:helix-turn-helix domain-containing protein [Streptomyces sp. B1866]MDT3395219.1 helix-turn-helix domain-containing protein [Streptomyces sp. B1866]